jgi:hypothetical protein
MAIELTKKEKGFVKDYIESGNGTEAVLNNYDTTSENTAASIASENLRKPKIQNAIKSIAESIPDEELIKVHTEGLQAVKMAGENAEIDFAVRHKYLDSAYKLKGSYAAEKKDIAVIGEMSNTQDPRLIALAEEYEQRVKKTL